MVKAFYKYPKPFLMVDSMVDNIVFLQILSQAVLELICQGRTLSIILFVTCHERTIYNCVSSTFRVTSFAVCMIMCVLFVSATFGTP